MIEETSKVEPAEVHLEGIEVRATVDDGMVKRLELRDSKGGFLAIVAQWESIKLLSHKRPKTVKRWCVLHGDQVVRIMAAHQGASDAQEIADELGRLTDGPVTVQECDVPASE